MRPFERGTRVMTRQDLRRSLYRLRQRRHEAAMQTMDWWSPRDQRRVVAVLSELQATIEDAYMLAKAVAEERRQKALEAEYRHAAQDKRMAEALQAFRETYRRDALPVPAGREAREAPQATDALRALEESYQRAS